MAAMARRSHRARRLALAAGACGALGGAAHAALGGLQRWAFASAGARPDILVVGGTGLMGAPTARLLHEQGHRVVVVSRGRARGQGTGGNRPEQPRGCETLVCDRGCSEAFVEALTRESRPRVVVDFTAILPRHVADIVEVHRRRPLDHYIFISTNMVYPGGVEDMDITSLPQPVTESAANLSAADAAPDTYGGRKLKCEAALQRAGMEQGLRWTVLRPPAVVGPGCDSRHERLQRLVAGLPPLPAKASKRPPTVHPGSFRLAYSGDVAEAASAVVELGERVHGEAFNIACPTSSTLDEYVGGIASSLGLGTPQVPDDPALRNYERQGELDVSKAQRVLGLKGTPLQRWLHETVCWHVRALAEAPAG